jgi:hypothetical protein
VSHPIVERILSGQVPENVKQAAARGALPIPREDLIELWVLLRGDADGEVRLACKESLAGVTEDEWQELLPIHEFAPQVLDFAVRVLGKNHLILQAALRSPHIPTASVEWAAAQTADWGVDMILDNQNRMIQAPQITVALLSNPNLKPTQVRQIFDLAEQFFREHPQIPGILDQKFGLKLGHAGGELFVEKEVLEEEPAPGAAEALAEVAALEVAEEELPPEGLTDEELTPDKFQNLYQRLLTMSVPAKIQLALKGNKEARTLLIRDNNKIIQGSVLDSPKLTDSEVELFTKMKNLPDEIFRKIARSHEFMKKYAVVRGLVFNAKVPPGVTMGLLPRIQDADLQILMKDKNVTELTRRQAKLVYEQRHQQKKMNFKKH